uniref:Secreted protein n=1 Tax=Heterorhabditis bacteriophora TaxID=37862 RepID=A0A1I7XM90_HETBA
MFGKLYASEWLSACRFVQITVSCQARQVPDWPTQVVAIQHPQSLMANIFHKCNRLKDHNSSANKHAAPLSFATTASIWWNNYAIGLRLRSKQIGLCEVNSSRPHKYSIGSSTIELITLWRK